MEKKELQHKIERIEKFILQNRYTLEEFNEMESYLKEVQPSWEGCPSCPAKVQFGKVLLNKRLEELRNQLKNFNEDQLPSTISTDLSETAEVAIETSLEELPPVPQGEVVVTSECKRCKKKRQTKG